MANKIRLRRFGSTFLALGVGMAAGSAALAQNTLEEVVVTGIRGSLNDSIEAKKADDHVAEVISADNIGQMPNVTVAESLIRLPGINGSRDRGNESLATVRGLGPRLTMGTVNGREIASSEPNRNVRWEVFPTEVVSTVKVYKSQSADLISGGVAGTVDIGTIDPLDFTGPPLVVSAGAAYYDEGKSIPDYNSLGDRYGLELGRPSQRESRLRDRRGPAEAEERLSVDRQLGIHRRHQRARTSTATASSTRRRGAERPKSSSSISAATA